MAGRILNEAMDGIFVTPLDFYLYRILSIIVGLIFLNLIRNTVKLENA
jgi:hypothetical protein